MEFARTVRFLETYFNTTGESHSDFVVALLGAAISDEYKGECKILDYSSKYLGRIFSGERNISKKDANTLIKRQDLYKLEHFFADRLDGMSADSFDELSEKLTEFGHENDGDEKGVASACCNLLIASIRSIIQGNGSDASVFSQQSSLDKSIEDLDKAVSALWAPTPIPVPDKHQDYEKKYILELYRAYGDAEGIGSFDDASIQTYSFYLEDLTDRRIDYFAAETIRRGIQELSSRNLDGQFNLLKEDTLDGIKDTAKKRYPNGYECMLAVMEQSVRIQPSRYILSNRHIGSAIK